MRCTKNNLKMILQKNGISSKGNKLQLIKKYAKMIALKKKEKEKEMVITIEKTDRIPMDTSEDNFVRIMDLSEDD